VGWVVAGGKVAHSDEAGLEGISIAEVKVQMCKRIKHIKLSQRGIAGQIPVTLAKVADLRTFLVNDNGLEGEIPHGIGGLRQLRKLGLFNNNLTGPPIPGSIGNLVKMKVFYCNDNALSGVIPESAWAAALRPGAEASSHATRYMATCANSLKWLFQARRTAPSARCMAEHNV
jgi:hypothetical protein